MVNKQIHPYRHLSKGLITIVIAALFLQLSPSQAAAQTKSSSLLSSLSSRRAKALRVSFTCVPAFPVAGQPVQFRDISTGNPASRQWDFGDGTGSVELNPTHVYASPGFRRVTLSIANGTVSRRTSRMLAVMPAELAASFVFSPTTPGPGQIVQFADTSSGNPTSWSWNFGDSSTSTLKNPSHAFARAGSYVVSLISTSSTGSKQASKTVTVASMSVLTSSFAFAPVLPSVGQAVQFTDTSTGSPTSWSWNFGDGATSATRNPSHAYTTAGAKTVTLTVTNNSGTNTSSQSLTVAAALTASFTFSPTSPVTGQSVQFTDMSSGNPASWSWTFGDGSTSTLQNPSHAYTTAGTKTVTLTVTNNSGTNMASRTVTVSAPLAASFSFSPSSPVTNQSVQFTDTSTGSPSIWQWTFGDGSTGTTQNPSHTYSTAGSYSVTLTIMNASGQNSVTRTVTVTAASSLAASFTFSPASPLAGQAVLFTDTSTGGPTSWSWDFGDGSTSAVQSPSHTYATAGVKTVTLTVANSSGSKSVSKTVSVLAALAASFSYTPTSPSAGQSVQFTDTSTGSPTSWSWTFGDGSTSTAQNPSHTYTTVGTKTVMLTATNGSGSNSVSRAVTVVATLTASFNYSPASPAAGHTVQFTDTSTGSPTSWSWTFGDGSTSTAQNPSHTYTTAGSKTVTLRATNSSGSNSVSRTVTVVAALTASFTYSPSSPSTGQTVQFTDTSTGSPASWSWDFNDGTTSTAQNPSHAFSAAGSYSVTLVATNSSTSKSVTQVVVVTSASTLSASFSYSPSSPKPNQAVQFTDTSTGTPVSWSWNFGDGSSSTVQNPSHAYAAVGSKTVTLTVTSSSGSSSASQTVTVATESTLIPADRRIDWTYCGVPGGIPNRTTIYTTLNPGATSSQISSALSNCPASQVVYLSAGTYTISGTIDFSKSNVTLRGAGAGQTILNCAGQAFITPQYGWGSGQALASGYTKGSTSVVFSSAPSGFVVNSLIMFDQDDDTSLVMATDGPGRAINLVHRITGISGNTITFTPPLSYPFTAGKNPRAMPLSSGGNPCVTMSGIENMSIRTTAGVGSVVMLASVDRCWLKGVEVKGGDIGVWVYHCNQVEIRHCFLHSSYGTPGNAEGYPLYLYAGTSNCLIEDNIYTKCAAGILLSRASNNAMLYNYGWQTTFNNFSFQYCMFNCNHMAHGLMNLWEGNMGEQFQSDGYHGSASHNTLFRNWFNGLHPTNTINRKMIDLGRASYYFNVVGNILGDSSWTPNAYEMSGDQGYEFAVIYRLGYPNMTNNDPTNAAVPWSSYRLTYPDATVKSTLLRHGNYDYYSKTTVWDSGISDHTLPASLVYSSKPSYFGSLQWPPFGPDVTGYVTTIPAKARWDAYQASGNIADLF